MSFLKHGTELNEVFLPCDQAGDTGEGRLCMEEKINIQKLIEQAMGARTKAYAPYSEYQVGAALLSARGRVYPGCNIENASYGATVCAERVAFFRAVQEGEREFQAIAIVGGKREEAPEGFCARRGGGMCLPLFSFPPGSLQNGGKHDKIR